MTPQSMTPQSPEPWLRGPIPDIHPALAPVLHSFAQVREDLALHTAGLSTEQVWKRAGDIPALGFQLRHIAGSVDRLVTYLCGDQLSDAQIAVLREEGAPGASLEELLAGVNAALDSAADRVQSIDPASLSEERFVGKKRLP